MENNARLPKKYRKVGYNYLSLKGDNVDNLFSLPPNDLKTILCLVNDYVNSLDLRRTVLSASDGLRSYKKAFETRKYFVGYDKDKMLDYCKKHNGIWGSNKNPYGDLYYYVDISKK